MPANKRVQAGKLAANRYRPTADARVCTAWTAGIAHFWFWVAPPSEVDAAELRWLPETLLLPAPATDGLRLLDLSRGCEAQYWRDGTLACSRWWPGKPSVDGWVTFVRAAGLNPADHAEVPDVQLLRWTAWPWGEQSWSERLLTAFNEKAVWIAMGLLFVLALGWQLAGLARWQVADMRRAAEVDRARATVAPLLEAREHAEQAQAELAGLRTLRTMDSDYVLMAELARHLPNAMHLVSWQREGPRLQVIVGGAGNQDPRSFVAAYAGNALLTDATATPMATGGMKLTFTVPVASAPATGGSHE